MRPEEKHWFAFEIAWHQQMLRQHQRAADEGVTPMTRLTGQVMVRARTALILALESERQQLLAERNGTLGAP